LASDPTHMYPDNWTKGASCSTGCDQP
jgi:hypothetical protein